MKYPNNNLYCINIFMKYPNSNFFKFSYMYQVLIKNVS